MRRCTISSAVFIHHRTNFSAYFMKNRTIFCAIMYICFIKHKQEAWIHYCKHIKSDLT